MVEGLSVQETEQAAGEARAGAGCIQAWRAAVSCLTKWPLLRVDDS